MSAPHTRHRARRALAIGVGLALIAALGSLLALAPPLYHRPRAVAPQTPGAGAPEMPGAMAPPAANPREAPARHAAEARAREVRVRFDEAVAMLHARRDEHAVAALHRVLELSPRLPEAHVNMGYALLRLRRSAAAHDFFAGAIALNPRQANAYYGLALASEALGALPEAMGAMRAFLHLSAADDPFRPKARAALWEWEALRAAPAAVGPAPAGPGAAGTATVVPRAGSAEAAHE
jgi:tetratricopeptide (TPR) repeat protein